MTERVTAMKYRYLRTDILYFLRAILILQKVHISFFAGFCPHTLNDNKSHVRNSQRGALTVFRSRALPSSPRAPFEAAKAALSFREINSESSESRELIGICVSRYSRVYDIRLRQEPGNLLERISKFEEHAHPVITLMLHVPLTLQNFSLKSSTHFRDVLSEQCREYIYKKQKKEKNILPRD